MQPKNALFNQPVLYKGVRVSCKSMFGYNYVIKTSEDQCYGFYEFITEFVRKLNISIKKEYNILMLTDSLGLFFEIPLLILLLVLTFSLKNNHSVLIALAIVLIISTVFFLIAKIIGTVNLNKKIKEFIAQNKPVLDDIGLYVNVFRARFFDVAPEVYLSILPSSLTLELDDNVNTQVNRSRIVDERARKQEETKLINDPNQIDEVPIHLEIKSQEEIPEGS